jgi:hypothetical protein
MEPIKKYNTIGCCGIDCGLCPRFYTKGDSACPGCGGKLFKEKHPSCGCLTCCVVKNGLEVCSECKDYPCRRYDSEQISRDSFVTHARIFANHDFIKKNGIARFIAQQKIRMNILKTLLAEYDEGRSKRFYCVSCALLPLNKLQEIQESAYNLSDSLDVKEKNKRIKDKLQSMAEKMKITLKLTTIK